MPWRENIRGQAASEEQRQWGRADAEQHMPHPIRRVGRTDAREIGTEAHLQIDDLDARLPGHRQDSGGGADGPLNHGQINSSTVEHATLGPEVILHVDDDHRSPCGLDRDRFRLRIEPDNLAFRVMNEMVCHRLAPPEHVAR